ncbi:MAG: TatD family hydrolase [Chlamydiales bacterium]|nr:TatD family hydrolase [Chlamydiia bacterium]MCP5507879.1 TatD family hydrolase [Chlamydiales bacterium]
MKSKFTDSHAHLTSRPVHAKIEQVLENAQSAGVDTIINICTDAESLEWGLDLAKKYPWIHNTGSTTPHDVDKEGEELFPLFEKHARAGDLVAIGETGLDYFYHHSQPETQQRFLRRYLHLALECSLPVVIHCRDAFSDFFHILDDVYLVNGSHAPGVLHCFTGTVEEAQEVIARGWYLSLSGIVTFKKSDILREVAKITPLDQLLIETDTPYLAPQTHRGKPNEPAYIAETAACIAEVRGISVEELAKATSANAYKLFKLR